MKPKPTPILNTVHKDVTERLLKIKPDLAENVRMVLEENKAERHIRGGEATKAKYNQATTKAG
jgi:putative DeoR family transcriptional regulator (stage III sporulation protein D)